MIDIMKFEDYASSEVDTDVADKSVPDYLERIAQAIRSEQGAITEYDAILQSPDLPPELVDIITEIQSDEKQHMVNLSTAIERFTVHDFPDDTDELSDVPQPDEGITDVTEL